MPETAFWTLGRRSALGLFPDIALALRWDRPLAEIAEQRQRLGRSDPGPRRIRSVAGALARLGKEADADLGEKLGVSASWVAALRQRRDIRSPTWFLSYRQARQELQESGLRVDEIPALYRCPSGFRLGSWLHRQRVDYRRQRLREDQIALLESIPHWLWSKLDRDFEIGFAALKRYVRAEGHARVPDGYFMADGYPLSTWVAGQRKAYLQGHRTMTPERITLLEAVSGWSWRCLTDDWEAGYQALLLWARDHDIRYLKVTQRDTNGFAIGQWASNQRHMTGKNNAELRRRRQLLEALPGWCWNQLDARWQRYIDLLEMYVQEHGHACVPQKCVLDDVRLGEWVSLQRTMKKRGKLSPARQLQLDSYPGWQWEVLQGAARIWQTYLNALASYIDYHGHSAVPYAYMTEDGLALGEWLSRRKSEIKKGTFPVALRKPLRAILAQERYRIAKSFPRL